MKITNKMRLDFFLSGGKVWKSRNKGWFARGRGIFALGGMSWGKDAIKATDAAICEERKYRP